MEIDQCEEAGVYDPEEPMAETLPPAEDDDSSNNDKGENVESMKDGVTQGNESDGEGAQECVDDSEVIDVDDSQAHSPTKTHLPLSRVKKIAKMLPGMHMINADAASIMALACERFVCLFARLSYQQASYCKRKTIQLKDLEHCIKNTAWLDFLEGTLEDWPEAGTVRRNAEKSVTPDGGSADGEGELEEVNDANQQDKAGGDNAVRGSGESDTDNAMAPVQIEADVLKQTAVKDKEQPASEIATHLNGGVGENSSTLVGDDYAANCLNEGEMNTLEMSESDPGRECLPDTLPPLGVDEQ